MTRITVFWLLTVLAAALSLNPACAADGLVWREVEPDRLVFLEMAEGQVVIELSPLFAPRTVKQFSKLASEGFYDGLPFYRVIDGFVAQGGDGSDLGEFSDIPLIDAEFEIDWDEELPWLEVQREDLFADRTGFVNGFAVGRDAKEDRAWLTHCPGVVAMARNEGPNTSRTDFYIVIGQAPRYLDRNMNVFGRVVHGMEVVQRIRRGEPDRNGIIEEDTDKSRIRRLRLGSDVPEEQRPTVLVPDTRDDSFSDLLDDRRDRKQKFFDHRPPKVLDVCQVPLGGRVIR
ncbi:MAG: peptidylprolyl isomerase [Gammaproteobacteria bacterium]|nr:peptidylprolyl isomerase [Gammaproteobacteria bacterium]